MRATSILLAVCMLTAMASADDLLPPEWRGLPNSTFQIWEFDDSSNPADPNECSNPYGDPQAVIYGEFDFPYRDTWWMDDDIAGHQGVWNIGGAMALEIPNDPELRPMKEIRLQVTYDGGHSSDPNVTFDPWVEVVATDGAEVVDFVRTSSIVLDDWFTHAVYDLVLEPNPSFETIWLMPHYCQLYIDEIVVDTICIPEPASLLLLAAGWALLRRKRT